MEKAVLKKEVENKELKLGQLEERIKLLTERKDLDDKILKLEKQASLLVDRTEEKQDEADGKGAAEPCPQLQKKRKEHMEVVKESSWNDFMAWRRSHPGPKTTRAYLFWIKNDCKDLPGFVWKKRGNDFNKKKGDRTIINNYY